MCLFDHNILPELETLGKVLERDPKHREVFCHSDVMSEKTSIWRLFFQSITHFDIQCLKSPVHRKERKFFFERKKKWNIFSLLNYYLIRKRALFEETVSFISLRLIYCHYELINFYSCYFGLSKSHIKTQKRPFCVYNHLPR